MPKQTNNAPRRKHGSNIATTNLAYKPKLIRFPSRVVANDSEARCRDERAERRLPDADGAPIGVFVDDDIDDDECTVNVALGDCSGMCCSLLFIVRKLQIYVLFCFVLFYSKGRMRFADSLCDSNERHVAR